MDLLCAHVVELLSGFHFVAQGKQDDQKTEVGFVHVWATGQFLQNKRLAMDEFNSFGVSKRGAYIRSSLLFPPASQSLTCDFGQIKRWLFWRFLEQSGLDLLVRRESRPSYKVQWLHWHRCFPLPYKQTNMSAKQFIIASISAYLAAFSSSSAARSIFPSAMNKSLACL